MAKYAAKTEVSEEKSRSEIESILRRYGADAFSYGWEENRAVIAFRAHNRHIRFEVSMPARDDESITTYLDRHGYKQFRTDSAAETHYYQARRQRWRALALVVKAKLEAVEAGISEFENEFLGHIVMPDGRTVAEHILPKIEAAYIEGKMPTLMLSAGASE